MHTAKTELRTRLKALLKENQAHLAQKSQLIRQSILEHPLWIGAKTVAIFAPLPSEPNILPLCPSLGKRLVFPKITAHSLQWLEVDDPQSQLSQCPESKMRLLEPNTQKHCPLSEIDLIFVPGLAFSHTGLRLGRGGGFYDRTLAQKSPLTKAIGVCFDFQLCDDIPIESHDRPVDSLFSA